MSLEHATIDGDRRVTQLLSEMADRASGIPATVWAKVGDVVSENMLEQFLTEGAHLGGKPWAPLSPPYLAYKLRNGLYPERLTATGDMASSFIRRPMAVETYGEREATFGSDDPKAAFHQRGTRKMPQRQIIDVDTNPDFADDVNSVLARYIFEDRL